MKRHNHPRHSRNGTPQRLHNTPKHGIVEKAVGRIDNDQLKLAHDIKIRDEAKKLKRAQDEAKKLKLAQDEAQVLADAKILEEQHKVEVIKLENDILKNSNNSLSLQLSELKNQLSLIIKNL